MDWPVRMAAFRTVMRPMVEDLFPAGKRILVVGEPDDVARVGDEYTVSVDADLHQPQGLLLGAPVRVIAGCGGEFARSILTRESNRRSGADLLVLVVLDVDEVDLQRESVVVDGSTVEERRVFITGRCIEGRVF